MRFYQLDDNSRPGKSQLLLPEYSEHSNPRALIANSETTVATVGLATPETMEAWLTANSPKTDAWRHWGINE